MRIYELEGKRTEDGKYHMQANQKEKKIVAHRKIAGAQSPILLFQSTSFTNTFQSFVAWKKDECMRRV